MCQKCEPSSKVPMPRCLEMSKFGFISFRQCPENTNACYSTETGNDRFFKDCCFFALVSIFLETIDGMVIIISGCIYEVTGKNQSFCELRETPGHLDFGISRYPKTEFCICHEDYCNYNGTPTNHSEIKFLITVLLIVKYFI